MTIKNIIKTKNTENKDISENIGNEGNNACSNSGIIATLTLNPSLDVFVSLDSPLTPGETNRSKDFHTAAGGKGINVSRELYRLGSPTAAYFPVGGDGGGRLERLISSEKLVYRCTHTSAETRTNYKFTDRYGVTTEVNGRGGPLCRDEIDSMLSVLYADFPIISTLVISGSLPLRVDHGIYGEIIDRAKAAGIKTVLDTSGSALSYGVRSCPDLIKPNRRELSELIMSSVLTVSDTVSGCRKIYEKYGTSVLCTLGENGSVYVGEEGVFEEKARPVKNIASTTGAGDCFLAGFLHSRKKGDNIKTAMICGAASAAERITSREYTGE